MDGILLSDTDGYDSQAFCIELAGIVFSIQTLHDSTRCLCKDYLVRKPADIHLVVTQADIEAERALNPPGSWSDSYLETLAVHRKIAEYVPLRRRMVFHGAAIAFRGRGYLFTAPSGTGKSTHIRLWCEHLGKAVTVINGDKPLIEVPRQGVPVVYGTPWAGKEGWQTNALAPLAGICFMRQGTANRFRALSTSEALDRAFLQVYLPFGEKAAGCTLELLDRLLSCTPLYELTCDMTEDALRCSFEGMTGLPY